MNPPERSRQRQPNPSALRQSTAPKRGRFGRLLLLAVCVAALAYWIGKRDGLEALKQKMRGPADDSALSSRSFACSDEFPPAGTVEGDSRWLDAATLRSKTTFANRTAADRVVDLLQGDRARLSIAVPADTDTAIELPVGAHEWRLRSGAAWCGRDWRFVREIRANTGAPLEIVASSNLTIDIAPSQEDPTRITIRLRDVPVVSAGATPSSPNTAVRANSDTLLIPRSADGHYFVDGSIDGEAVRFMIDTGASVVVLPVTLARRLGYYQGREVPVHTAGGQSSGSAFKVRRITFGPFSAQDVTVIAMMNLETPLLGMALLQSVELRHTQAGLEIRRIK